MQRLLSFIGWLIAGNIAINTSVFRWLSGYMLKGIFIAIVFIISIPLAWNLAKTHGQKDKWDWK